jgi:hypothetical protein
MISAHDIPVLKILSLKKVMNIEHPTSNVEFYTMCDVGRSNRAPHEERSRDKGFSEVTCGRAPSFPDLSEGEALAPAPQEQENSGGGKFPSQISHRKDQPGNLGTKE